MLPLIRQNLTLIKGLCQRYEVHRLELFGSATAQNHSKNVNDIDLLVEFNKSTDMGPADQYFGLKTGMEKLFDKPVDLVCAKSMTNPYFIEEVNNSRELIYATQARKAA